MRLAAKLTIAFGAVTLLPLVPLTLVAREVIANRYRQELRRGLDEAAIESERAYEAAARDVERTVARIAHPDDPFARTLALMLITREPGPLPDEVRRTLSDKSHSEAKGRALDVLLVVAQDGTILASPDDPGREGSVDAALVARLRAGGARAHVVEDKPLFVHEGTGRLAIEAARLLSFPAEPRRGVWVVAGVWLDDALPEKIGEGRVERRVRPASSAPSDALVKKVELDAGADKPPIPVELWATDRTLRAALTDLNLAAAALAIGGAVLALIAGGVLARRLGGRLSILAEGADAIARGRRELSLPVSGGDEIAALTGRFNEMVGALDEAEKSAVRAERVAAWREMAQHLAHELKNPLTPIQMSIETLQRTRARPDRAADFDRIFDESAKVILDEVSRLKHIVSEFSRFARLPAPTIGAVDVRELCEGAARLYDGATPIARELATDLPKARADRDQLQQVLVNLLENAREAVAGVASPRVVLRAAQRGDRLVIEVLDNGEGIADSVRSRLFQPYATSKQGGTGLGLALVHRIVTEHGGKVTAEEGLPTDKGAGACFRVELPIA